MAFSSSDSPEEGFGAGDRPSGGTATAGYGGGVLRVAEDNREGGKGVLTDGKRVTSASAELSVGVRRGLGVKGDSLELGKVWASSVNSTNASG